MMESAWRRRLTCMSGDAEVPVIRGVVSVVVMVCFHIFMFADHQVLAALLPKGIKCHNSSSSSSCHPGMNLSSETLCDGNNCIEMTRILEGLLLGPLTGIALLCAPVITHFLSSATSQVMVVVIGGLIWSCMALLTSYGWLFWILAVARFGTGFGLSLCLPASDAISSLLYNSSRSAHRLKLVFHLAVVVGGSLGYLLALTVQVICWRVVFFILSIAGFATVLVTILLVREPCCDRREYIYKKDCPSTLEFWSEVVKSKVYAILCLAVVAQSVSSYALQAWLATYYAYRFHLSPADYGLKLGVTVLCGGIAGCIIGSYNFYKFQGHSKAFPVLIVAGGQLLALSCLAPALLVSSPRLSFGLLFVVYLSGATWQTCAVSVSEASFSEQLRGQATTFCLRSGHVVGSIAGPLLVPALSYSHSEWKGCDRGIAVPLLYVATIGLGLGSILFFTLAVLLRKCDGRPSLEETIYLMYDTSDMEPVSEQSFSEKDSSI